MEVINTVPEHSALSLQPLIRTRSDNDRGPKIFEKIYQPGVLEANWVEASAKILPSRTDEWTTLYETSYRPYKTEFLIRPKFEAWEQRILTQGNGARVMIDHHGTKYHNNWTTSHDLSFKVLPKGLCGPRHREFNARKKEWLPAQDYATIYGNLTEYGLTDFMRHKWAVEIKPIRPWRTSYQDDFPNYESTPSSEFHLGLNEREAWYGGACVYIPAWASVSTKLQLATYKYTHTRPLPRLSPEKTHPVQLFVTIIRSYFKPKGSLNKPDLRHLGIDLLAFRQSCPIAFKAPNPLSCCEFLEKLSNKDNICKVQKGAGECSTRL